MGRDIQCYGVVASSRFYTKQKAIVVVDFLVHTRVQSVKVKVKASPCLLRNFQPIDPGE